MGRKTKKFDGIHVEGLLNDGIEYGGVGIHSRL